FFRPRLVGLQACLSYCDSISSELIQVNSLPRWRSLTSVKISLGLERCTAGAQKGCGRRGHKGGYVIAFQPLPDEGSIPEGLRRDSSIQHHRGTPNAKASPPVVGSSRKTPRL